MLSLEVTHPRCDISCKIMEVAPSASWSLTDQGVSASGHLSFLGPWAFTKPPSADPQSDAWLHSDVCHFPALREQGLAGRCFLPPVPQPNLATVSLSMATELGFYSLISNWSFIAARKTPLMPVAGRISLLTSPLTQFLPCQGARYFGKSIPASLSIYHIHDKTLDKNREILTRNTVEISFLRVAEAKRISYVSFAPNSVKPYGQSLVLKNPSSMIKV